MKRPRLAKTAFIVINFILLCIHITCVHTHTCVYACTCRWRTRAKLDLLHFPPILLPVGRTLLATIIYLFTIKSGQKTLTICVRNIFESFTLDTLGTHIKNKFILWIYELPVELIDGFCTYFHVLMISLVRVKGITVFLLILYVLFLTVFRGNPR